MNAVVMAGGFGNRLRPLTESVPKPMLNVCNRPMIDYCVAQLYHFGIRYMVFTLGYKPEQIIEWAIGYKGITTHFAVEETPLGTLGGVKAVSHLLDDRFVVLSGDGLNNVDLNAMLNHHLRTGAEVTIAIKKVDNPALYGLVEKGEDGLIKSFIEKPHGIIVPAYVNTGTYIIEKKVLDYIDTANCDFAKDLFPALVAKRTLAYYEHDGYWQDVGDFQSYYNANFEMLESHGGAGFFPFISNYGEGRFSSRLSGNREPSLCAISANIKKSDIKASILGPDCSVINAKLYKCVVVSGSTVKGVQKGAIIADGTTIDVVKQIEFPGEKGQKGKFLPQI